jgi:hydrogenase maturation protease
MKEPILILGIGNLLLKDEGIGVHVARKLGMMPLPPGVEVMDGGTMGMNLMYDIEGREKVIVIDAVLTDGQPGTLYRFTDKDIEYDPGMIQSVHGMNFPYVLKNIALFGKKPELIVFIGIKPAEISEGIELTPEIEKKIPEIIELVMKEIEVSS